MIKLNKEVQDLRAKMRARMKELEPVIKEHDDLMEKLDIVEFALATIKALSRPAATSTNVVKWAESLHPDEIVRASEMSEAFGKSRSWGQLQLNKLVDKGVMEKWGKGQWRRKPDRAGEAHLRVVTR